VTSAYLLYTSGLLSIRNLTFHFVHCQPPASIINGKSVPQISFRQFASSHFRNTLAFPCPYKLFFPVVVFYQNKKRKQKQPIRFLKIQDYGKCSAFQILPIKWIKILQFGGIVLHFHRIAIPNGFLFLYLTLFSFSLRK
jgi:hypothetical protein